MLTCGIVILNYKDYSVTEELLSHIKDTPEIDHIVIVDNESPNDSYSQLKKHESEKISVIQSGKNGGYSYGNNVGAKYLIEHFHPDIIGIANPDVIFDGSLVGKVKEIFEAHNEYAVLTGAGLYKAANGDVIYSNLWDEISDAHSVWKSACKATLMTPFPSWMKKFVKKLLRVKTPEKKESYIERIIHSPDTLSDVWAVCGCLFFIRTDDFVKLGMFDDNVFLYCEEFILAYKLQKLGRKTGVTKEATFFHNHIHPDTPLKLLQAKRAASLGMNASFTYYFEHYMTSNKFMQITYRLFQKVERWKINRACDKEEALITSANTSPPRT